MNTNKLRYLTAGLLTVAVTAGGMLCAPAGNAAPLGAVPVAAAASASLPSADTVFQDFNNAALFVNSSGTSYSSKLVTEGKSTAYNWQFATDISAAEDAYQRNHTPANFDLVNALVTKFIAYNKTNWASYDNWNDDIGWMSNAVLRGYEATGNKAWLQTVETQWNAVYDRGWSSNAGGGIWENNSSKNEKGHLSNDPFVWTGVELYRLTGDTSYLTKSTAIYDWVRKNMVASSGELKHAVEFPNGQNGATTLSGGEKAYDVGIFVEAAGALYRVTGDQQYVNDGLKVLDYLARTTPVKTSQYWLFRGLNEFCTDADVCSRYAAWEQTNAAAAWKQANKAGLTAIDWTTPTAGTGLDPFALLGMVGLFQVLPDPNAKALAGTYLIRNAGSNLAIGVQNNSTTAAAPVEQGASTTSASWTLIPESNGYYEIKNTLTGQLLNVAGASGLPGAKVLQWPARNTWQGNDQWLPIHNADGSYSFYSRNSQLALDDTGATATAGVQLQQWQQDNGRAQKFTLTRQ